MHHVIANVTCVTYNLHRTCSLLIIIRSMKRSIKFTEVYFTVVLATFRRKHAIPFCVPVNNAVHILLIVYLCVISILVIANAVYITRQRNILVVFFVTFTFSTLIVIMMI